MQGPDVPRAHNLTVLRDINQCVPIARMAPAHHFRMDE